MTVGFLFGTLYSIWYSDDWSAGARSHISCTKRKGQCTDLPVAALRSGNRLRAGKPPRHATSHSEQISLLPSAGREINTSQSAVMLCRWRVKAGWLIPHVDKRVGGG